MAITSSAKRAIRGSARKRVFNLRKLRAMNGQVKETKVVAREDKAKAREQYRLAQKAIDKAAKRGVIKTNTASRKKARLARAIKATS